MSSQHRTLPFNDPDCPFEYETELFKGRALVLLKNLPSSPEAAFEGKRRTCYVVVQVRSAPWLGGGRGVHAAAGEIPPLSTPPHSPHPPPTHPHHHTRTQKTPITVKQGQFKRPVRCDALIMGADFQGQLKLPPKLFLVGTRLGNWIARRAGGSTALQLRGPRPYAHSRVITAAQVRGWGGVCCVRLVWRLAE
jgi:hypothetical protein